MVPAPVDACPTRPLEDGAGRAALQRVGKPTETSPSPQLGFLPVRHPPEFLGHTRSGVQLIMTSTSTVLGISQFLAV